MNRISSIPSPTRQRLRAVRSRLLPILVVGLFYFGVLVYPVLRIWHLLTPVPPGTLALLLVMVGPIALRLSYEWVPGTFTRWLSAIALTWLGVCFMAFTIVITWEVVHWLVPLSDRTWGLVLLGCVSALSVYALRNAQTLAVKTVDLTGPASMRGQRLVQIGRLVRQCMGPLEEGFGGHGKELGRVGRAIGVQNGRRHGLQPCVGLGRHRRPVRARCAVALPRLAVGSAAVLVDLVGKLVQHHVARVGRVGRPREHLRPCQYHLALAPGLTRQHLRLHVDHAALKQQAALHHEGIGIDQHLAQPRVTIRARMTEQQQAGLRGDDDAHDIVYGLALAANEGFFGEKDLDLTLQLPTQRHRQACRQGNLALHDGRPVGREGLCAQALVPARGPPGLRQQRHHGGQHQRGQTEQGQRDVEFGGTHRQEVVARRGDSSCAAL